MKKFKWIRVAAMVIVVILVVILTSPPGMTISQGGLLSISSHVALAVQMGTMGDWEPVPQGVTEFILRRGGPPITSISYDFEAVGDGEVLRISFVSLPDIVVRASDVPRTDLVTAEETVRQYVQKSFEVWTFVADFPADDPIRNKPNPILLDHERIEKVDNKDYLVSTIAYFDIHIYLLDPLRFITKINGLDLGLIEGEWWN